MRKKQNNKTLSEAEIDSIVIEEADDNSAWEAPINVKREPLTVSLPTEVASEAAFFARFYDMSSVEEWLVQIIRERLATEQAMFYQMKKSLAVKRGNYVETDITMASRVAEEQAVYQVTPTLMTTKAEPLSKTEPSDKISFSQADELETFLRRIVREEMDRAFPPSLRSMIMDWAHEGPDDPEGDEQLFQEALETWETYKDKPETWKSWEDVEADLDRLEAAGELPD